MKQNLAAASKKFITIGGIIVAGAMLGILPTAFGWGNPPGAPPTGNGILSAYNNNSIGIMTATPSTTLTVNGEISSNGFRVRNVHAPTNLDDAVNLGYLQTYVTGASGSGGGSIVLYYKTINDLPAAPSCPSGWTNADPFGTGLPGYGPHYLGVLAQDWQNTNGTPSGGYGNAVPGAPGTYNYNLKSVAIGSDSVCSRNSTSVVPFTNIFNNGVTTAYTSMRADACFTDTTTGAIECNRCIVCEK